jgi:AraC-like DNA-binding protein
MIENFAQEVNYEIPVHLRQYVVALIKGESKSKVNFTYPAHPSGFPLLVSVYNDVPVAHTLNKPSFYGSRLVIGGQLQNANMNIEIKGHYGQLGIIFMPTALYYLFHKKGAYLLNSLQDFEKVTQLKFQNLLSKLEACEEPEERFPILFDVIERLAQDRLPAIDWLDASLQNIFDANGKISQTELVEKSGIGVRHFRRKFKEIIGVPPKYYCKVIQMNTVFELLKTSNLEEIYRLALDCGYYDQAHFINDFKQMIGSSPTNFLNGEHALIKSYLGRKA